MIKKDEKLVRDEKGIHVEKKEKWKPAHKAITELLEEVVKGSIVGDLGLAKIYVATKLYGEKKVKAPLEGIPRLKKALRGCKKRTSCYEKEVDLALSNLEQQEKEEREKKMEKLAKTKPFSSDVSILN